MQDLNPLVSVIIPTFNRAHTIERALNSVFNQTYNNIELIVVDDGSTDTTQNILEKINNIKIIKTENNGVSSARNTGVENCIGKYIAFLDSDDEWLPEKLQLQIEFIINHPNLKWVHGDEIWIRNGVRVNQMKKHKKGGGDQFMASLNLCLISPSCVLLEKKLITQENGFKTDFIVCEDYDLWLRLLSEYEIGFIDKPLINKFGGHDDQLSQKYFAMDYYRIKSIHYVLENKTLDEQKINTAKEVLIKKSQILLKGYKKHNNLENYQEISDILETYL